MTVTPENILLIASVLIFISVLAGKTSLRIGVPILILFLAVGMLAGSDSSQCIFPHSISEARISLRRLLGACYLTTPVVRRVRKTPDLTTGIFTIFIP